MSSVLALLALLMAGCGPARAQDSDPSARPSSQLTGPGGIPLDSESPAVRDATYVVVAPGVVRPGTIYRVLFDVRRGPSMVDVRVALLRSGVQMASAKSTVQPLNPRTLLLQVPPTSVAGDYSVRIEGNHPGAVGGTLFANETRVHFSSRFLTILIQTSRPVYNGEQTIRFRAIMLNHRLRPFDDPVDVYILDPNGYVMRWWSSRPTVNGIVSLAYRLPFLPKVGSWTIRVKVRGQLQEKSVIVEKYYIPRYEVDVDMPMYLLTTDKYIEGTVRTKFTRTKKPAAGNMTLQLYFRERQEALLNRSFSASDQRINVWVNGPHQFRFSMDELVRRVPRIDGAEIRVVAAMTEFFEGLNQTGFCVSRVINSSVSLQFIGSQPMVYKPNMPFSAVVSVSHHDGQPLSPSRLRGSTLNIVTSSSGTGTDHAQLNVPRYQPLSNTAYRSDHSNENYYEVSDGGQRLNVTVEHLLEEQLYTQYRTSGLHRFTFQAPARATARVQVTARYTDKLGATAVATMTLLPYYSPNNRYILVESSTLEATVGEYVVLHVRSNFNMDKFSYVVSSKGLLLYADDEVLGSGSGDTPGTGGATVHTLSLPVASEMAPLFRVVVYHVTADGELLTDSIALPIDAIDRRNVSLILNQSKDRLKDSVEAVCQSAPGSMYGLSALRRDGYTMAADCELSRSSVQRALYSFENFTRSVHSVTRTYRGGLRPDTVEYFVSPNYGVDANRTLEFAQLVVFTDARIPQLPSSLAADCNASLGLTACMTGGGCYRTKEDHCDGRQSCSDGSDEADCRSDVQHRDNSHFRLHRKNRQRTLYNQLQGDWAWKDIYIGYKASEERILRVPRQDALYYVTGFSVSQTHGFGIIEQPLVYNTTRPFHMRLEMANQCRRGEQVSLRAALTSGVPYELLTLLELPDSPHYRFIHVEADGSVQHYAPRLSGGKHQLLVPLAPYQTKEVDIPIALLIESGTVNVTLSARTQVGRDDITRQLTVVPEGVTINRHTSLLLDLKNRAVEYKFLDLLLDKTPVIAFVAARRFVFGSPLAHLTITGDVVGPIFPTGGPVTAQLMLNRRLRSAETSAYEFGTNFWSLNYLRLTKQLDLNFARAIFEQMNVDMAAILYRCDVSGAYSMWDGAPPSVWLTAWITRIFDEARFQDWEDFLYVEPRVVWRSVDWLLRHQNPVSGAFGETRNYTVPLDTKVDPRSSRANDQVPMRNVSLTAQVLITISNTMESLQGDLRSRASHAKLRATAYLERELPALIRPYEIAVVAYALSLANSGEGGTAFDKLQSIKREHDKLVYWSPVRIEPNTMSNEVSQRDLLQPKTEQVFDARAVETTAYALLVYLLRDGVSIDQEKIVLWLNTMRMTDGGFISSTDSLMALQALTIYSYRARLRDITDMRVNIKWSSGPIERQLTVDNDTLSKTNRLDFAGVWGHVQLTGQGAGQALAQLDIQYGVDTPSRLHRPPQSCFQLDVTERYLPFRNKSIGIVSVCTKWLYVDDTPESGAAVLEIETPSGYVLYQPDADETVLQAQREGLTQLRHAIGAHAYSHEPAAVWFFDSIPGDRSVCFNYTIRRWFPVANMTQYRRALIYEQYQPERFEVQIVNSTTLYVLNVCDVCGSYQCPYCPFYSTADRNTLSLPLPLLIAAVVVATARRLMSG